MPLRYPAAVQTALGRLAIVAPGRNRTFIGEDAHAGVIISFGSLPRPYAWVRPLGLMPSDVEAMFSNDPEDERKLYMDMADIIAVDVVVELCAQVFFGLYRDSKGAGVCGITSA